MTDDIPTIYFGGILLADGGRRFGIHVELAKASGDFFAGYFRINKHNIFFGDLFNIDHLLLGN
jgi:hypothetical protein